MKRQSFRVHRNKTRGECTGCNAIPSKCRSSTTQEKTSAQQDCTVGKLSRTRIDQDDVRSLHHSRRKILQSTTKSRAPSPPYYYHHHRQCVYLKTHIRSTSRTQPEKPLSMCPPPCHHDFTPLSGEYLGGETSRGAGPRCKTERSYHG